VQPLIEEQVRVRGYGLPLGEGARLPAIDDRLLGVVDVVPALPGAGGTVALKQLQLLVEEIALGTEMAQVAPVLLGLGQFLLHLVAVEAVEAVALDEGGTSPDALEDMLQGILDGAGAGTG